MGSNCSSDCSQGSIVGTQEKPDLSAHWFELYNRHVLFHLLSCHIVPREHESMIDTFRRLAVLWRAWKMPRHKIIHDDLWGSSSTSNKASLDISVADVESCQPEHLQITDPVICMQGWTACLVKARLGSSPITPAILPMLYIVCFFSPNLVMHRPAATGT